MTRIYAMLNLPECTHHNIRGTGATMSSHSKSNNVQIRSVTGQSCSSLVVNKWVNSKEKLQMGAPLTQFVAIKHRIFTPTIIFNNYVICKQYKLQQTLQTLFSCKLCYFYCTMYTVYVFLHNSDFEFWISIVLQKYNVLITVDKWTIWHYYLFLLTRWPKRRGFASCLLSDTLAGNYEGTT